MRTLIIIVILTIAGCGDNHEQKEILSVPATLFLQSLYVADVPMYRYTANKNLVLKEVSKVLDEEFTGTSMLQNNETFLFQTKENNLNDNAIDKKINCLISAESLGQEYVLLEASCDVYSYWTRWNKPATPNLFDFFSWKSDWYFDPDSSHKLDVFILEKIRNRLNLTESDIKRYKNILDYQKERGSGKL